MKSVIGLSTLKHYRLPGGASRLAALLIAHLCPTRSLFAPCGPGAALRQRVVLQRGQAARVKRWPSVFAVVVLLVFCTGFVGLAQRVIFTADDLDKAMKALGQAFGPVNAMIASKDFDTAKVQVARSRDQLARTVGFWRNKDAQDAVKMVRDAAARLDELDSALSANSIDASAVTAAAQQVGVACGACHAVYREQDPATKAFRLKRGLVD